MPEHNFLRNPFGPDEPPRRLVPRGTVWDPVEDPTQTVRAVLEYGDLKWDVQVLPGGALAIWVHGSNGPTMMVQWDGAANTATLVLREIFDGPLWRHPARSAADLPPDPVGPGGQRHAGLRTGDAT